MKNYRFDWTKGIVRAIVVLAVLAGRPVSAEDMTLQHLVREVKVALLKVQQASEKDSLPPLETAELELNTVQSRSADGKISFLIVQLGGGGSREMTHSVKLTLRPPPSKSGTDVASVELADTLAASILAGARAIAVAKKGLPPLDAQELKVSVKFALKAEGGGKLSLAFPPFEVGGGGSLSNSAIQSITVVYKYK